MLNFFSKKDNSNVFEDQAYISYDIHSHILPGLDDGAADINASLLLVKGMYNMGIRKAVATPHIIGDMYRNNPDTINTALEKLKTACEQEKIDIELSAAAEYMLDDYFISLLRKKAPLLTVYDNLILTELPYTIPPSNLEEIAFEIITGGYKPIMAHPERYFYYHKDYDNYYRLKELGFVLQVNLLSITGYYGIPFAKAAKFILDEEMADLLGTDMHHLRHLETLNNKENIKLIKRCIGDKVYNDFSLIDL